LAGFWLTTKGPKDPRSGCKLSAEMHGLRRRTAAI
jgi:hypothetical protein